MLPDDTATSDFMAMMQGMKADSQAAAVRAEGKAALTAGVIGAFTTLAGGLNEYNQVKTPSYTPSMSTAPPLRNASTARPSLFNSAYDYLSPRG